MPQLLGVRTGRHSGLRLSRCRMQPRPEHEPRSGQRMRVGIFRPTWLDLSVASYLRNVVRELQPLGVEAQYFATPDPLPPECDVYWDPRLTGGTQPWHRLADTTRPVVVTLHGAAPLAVPPWEYYESLLDAARGLWGVARRLAYWRRWRLKCAAIITNSEDARRLIERRFWLGGENLVAIHHGVAHDLFRPPANPALDPEPYLLHVAAYQPIKNLARILRAFRELRLVFKKMRLVAVAPGYRPSASLPDGVSIVTKPLTHDRLVPLYQRATGFVFPSLTESFGMPILEAMACGCPVLTSSTSACGEIAGDAALTVNPRSTQEIREAMERLVSSREERERLTAAGLERARGFTWQRSAREHLAVFDQAARPRDRTN